MLAFEATSYLAALCQRRGRRIVVHQSWESDLWRRSQVDG